LEVKAISVTQLIPWSRNRNALARMTASRDPFFALQREVNRLFDDMWGGFDLSPLHGNGMPDSTWPHIDLVNKEKEFVLSVEVPGVEEKDIDIRFADQCVILRGQRNEERNEKETDRRYSERSHGRFERRIPLSVDIDAEKAKAVLRNGVLTVTLPKAAQIETTGHRIPVSSAA
jgi:HSP20 family protein